MYSGTGYFKEQVWSGIKSDITKINGKKDYSKIKVDTDDDLPLNTDTDLPLNKSLQFPTLTTFLDLFFKKIKNCIHKLIWMSVCMKYKNDSIRKN